MSALRRDKGNCGTRLGPKSYGTFEKQGPVSRKSRNFSGTFGVAQCFLYVQSEGVLRHETLQLFYYIFPLQHMKKKKQLYRISGSQFYEWLFGPEMFSGLSRNRPQAPGRSRWPVEANDKHSVLQSIVECAVFNYLFGRVAREKPFVKLRPAYSLKLFFSYVVKGVKVKKKNNCKVSCFETSSF